jgi:signal transduction histidine kinase
MSKKSSNSQELAELLRKHQDEIIPVWAKKIADLPNTHFKQLSLGDLTNWTSKGIATIIETLETNSDQVIERYISDLAIVRLQAGFPIYEVTNRLLLSKEAIIPFIWSFYPAGSSEIIEAVIQLDVCLRKLIGRFEELFSEKMYYQLLEESQKQLVESEALQRTMTALIQGLALDEVLEIVCFEARKLTGAAGSAVLLLEGEEWLEVTISTGDPLPIIDRLPVQDSLAGKAVREGSPLLINEPRSQLQAYQRNPGLEDLIVVPLLVDGKSIGVIDVVNKPKGFVDEDLRIMSLFADQAAIAIENARLRHQAEKLVVIEERQRLARELHDSVTQSLYSVTLFADAARLALSSGNTAEAIGNLTELRNMAREAMLDMRLLIFELHPPILEKEGLVTAIKTRLESVEARSGIETEFMVEGERRLPISIESELYRISQEALNNVTKHAKAQCIKMKLLFNSRTFRMEIWDDGIGFDPNIIKQGSGMGLRGIKERVQKMNGELSIDTSPGQGTTIVVEIDL